jgi:anti-sigma B factor antagonist
MHKGRKNRMREMQSNVIVMTFPSMADARRHSAFMQELAKRMGEYRPRVVLDCGGLKSISRPAIYLLLCCLEEALKRNGDVRLAGISAAVKMALEGARADRLFLIFSSRAEAVQSFDRSIAEFALLGGLRGSKDQSKENAA